MTITLSHTIFLEIARSPSKCFHLFIHRNSIRASHMLVAYLSHHWWWDSKKNVHSWVVNNSSKELFKSISFVNFDTLSILKEWIMMWQWAFEMISCMSYTIHKRLLGLAMYLAKKWIIIYLATIFVPVVLYLAILEAKPTLILNVFIIWNITQS